MIHVVIGDGKGKTTSSVGLAVRAAGHGLPVLFMQFLKDDSSGEISVLRKIEGIEVRHSPVHYGFTFQMTAAQLKETAEKYDAMMDYAISSNAALIILDESLHALQAGLIRRDKLEQMLKKDCEIVLTGADAPEWIKEKADYISCVNKIKHPYDQGVLGRVGIEY